MKYSMMLIAAAAGLMTGCGASESAAAAVDLDPALASLPWPAFYERATQSFGAGRQDEAVTLFYVGQLRARITVECRSVQPDREPAVLASLNATVGQAINEYAGGSPAGWAAAIDRALAWDQAHPDPALDTSRCRSERQRQRQGLTQLRDTVRASADQIRRERTANGLPNR